MNYLLNDIFIAYSLTVGQKEMFYQTAINKKTACDCLFIGEVSYTNKQTITS